MNKAEKILIINALISIFDFLGVTIETLLKERKTILDLAKTLLDSLENGAE